MQELSSLGIDLILIRLEGIRDLLIVISAAVCGILAGMIGFSIAYLMQLRKKNKGK